MSVKRSDPVDIEVGHRIRIERLARGLSQTALANQLGVTFQQVQKYEKGVNRVGAGRLTKIAAVLGIEVSTFFGAKEMGEGDAPKESGAASPLKQGPAPCPPAAPVALPPAPRRERPPGSPALPAGRTARAQCLLDGLFGPAASFR